MGLPHFVGLATETVFFGIVQPRVRLSWIRLGIFPFLPGLFCWIKDTHGLRVVAREAFLKTRVVPKRIQNPLVSRQRVNV